MSDASIKELFGKWGLPILSAAIGGLFTFAVALVTVGRSYGHTEEKVTTLQNQREEDRQASKELSAAIKELSGNIEKNNTATQVMVTTQQHLVAQQQEIRDQVREVVARVNTIESELARKSVILPGFGGCE